MVLGVEGGGVGRGVVTDGEAGARRFAFDIEITRQITDKMSGQLYAFTRGRAADISHNT